MLASVRGTVIQKNENAAVIECNGLGIELALTRAAAELCEIGANVFLYVHMQISEAGISLFGFADEQERQIFRLTLLTKGVGGKVAISLLQNLSSADIVSAVERNDPAMLTSVPGIGKKTAERICFELEGRIQRSGLSGLGGSVPGAAVPSVENGVLDALEALGFARAAALKAYKTLIAENPSAASWGESESIMGCLKILQPR